MSDLTLPFTPEVFFSLFAQYNAAIWPAQFVACALGIAAVLLALRPGAYGGRVIAAILALFWIWIGVVYHLTFFRTINFLAGPFGAVFLVQGALLAWTGVVRGRLEVRFRPAAAGWCGLGLAVFALLIYPLLNVTMGHGWPAMPVFGVTPCPTTIFTLGLLLMASPRVPWHLAVVPLLWSLIGTSAAWLLDVPEDFSLLLAALVFLAAAVASKPGPEAKK